MAVRLERVFGASAERWLVRQAQHELAHIHRGRIKLKGLQPGWSCSTITRRCF
jgi:plasmid maintenance system antidote protein VapI